LRAPKPRDRSRSAIDTNEPKESMICKTIRARNICFGPLYSRNPGIATAPSTVRSEYPHCSVNSRACFHPGGSNIHCMRDIFDGSAVEVISIGDATAIAQDGSHVHAGNKNTNRVRESRCSSTTTRIQRRRNSKIAPWGKRTDKTVIRQITRWSRSPGRGRAHSPNEGAGPKSRRHQCSQKFRGSDVACWRNAMWSDVVSSHLKSALDFRCVFQFNSLVHTHIPSVNRGFAGESQDIPGRTR
jgi:hypothetical protein